MALFLKKKEDLWKERKNKLYRKALFLFYSVYLVKVLLVKIIEEGSLLHLDYEIFWGEPNELCQKESE